MAEESFEQFKQMHLLQLQQIPTLYWKSLFEKLKDEVMTDSIRIFLGYGEYTKYEY